MIELGIAASIVGLITLLKMILEETFVEVEIREEGATLKISKVNNQYVVNVTKVFPDKTTFHNTFTGASELTVLEQSQAALVNAITTWNASHKGY